tara:strand:+ start:120627 stop:121478 length:852 start_codon:yes stop_codon:yes gene_type:complete
MNTIITASKTTRPFLKWPGGKMRLIHFLKQHLPEQPILVEPFVGAGALFANTQHKAILINDINHDLINIYKQIKKNHRKFSQETERLFHPRYNNKKKYYQLREKFNQCEDRFERACLFLYLNRHGYNGLCRYNLQGGYNVPFGDYLAPYFPKQELAYFSQRLKAAKMSAQSFTTFLKKLCKHPDIDKMVVYCDPPYVPLSKTANFTGYAACKFNLQDQENLAELALVLISKGAKVMLSNHDTPFTRQIYDQAHIKTIQVRRAISCQAQKREQVAELIAVFDAT